MAEDVLETELSVAQIREVVADLLPGYVSSNRLGRRMGIEGGAYLVDGDRPEDFYVFYGNRKIKTAKFSTCFFLVSLTIDDVDGRRNVVVKTKTARLVNDSIQTPKPHEEIRDGIVASIRSKDASARVVQDRHAASA